MFRILLLAICLLTSFPQRLEAQLIQAFGMCICPSCALGYHKHFTIPSASMEPALAVGDCILAKAHWGTDKSNGLKRGQIVFFASQQGDIRIGRIIALSGDTVQMQGGKVVLNGEVLEQVPEGMHEVIKERRGAMGTIPRCHNDPLPMGELCLKEQDREILPDGTSYLVLNIAQTQLDDTALFEVPEGHVFIMGDNRDNSLDSRYPAESGGAGFVPVERVHYLLSE